MRTFLWGCWDLFIVVRSCLLPLQSKLLILVEQVSYPCRASFLSLQSKPLILAEQVSWNMVGKSGPSSCRGPTWKDGLYLLWACGYGPIGLAKGPIGLTRPYLTFYPLQLPLLDYAIQLFQSQPRRRFREFEGWMCMREFWRHLFLLKNWDW